jgi:pimeloyl-ACP methyl ester carboxylesterase
MMGPAGELHVDDGGQGDVPVVFVHSLGGEVGHFAAQLAHLRRTRRALAVDMRGHGRSSLRSGAALTPQAYAEDLAAVTEALRLGPCVLVGHSAGGAAALAYAARAPAAVAGLLLLDPASDGRDVPTEAAQGMLAALDSEAYREVLQAHWSPMLAPSTPAVREQVLAGLFRTPRAVVRGTLEALLSFDPVAALARYPGPRLALVTHFNDSPSAYHRHAPGLPHQRVDGVGHWLQLDAPLLVNGLLDGFLARLP